MFRQKIPEELDRELKDRVIQSFLVEKTWSGSPSIGGGDRIRREVKKIDLSLGRQITRPWKQTEDSKKTTWWAGIQEILEDVSEAAKV